jgi:hypothetical protein
MISSRYGRYPMKKARVAYASGLSMMLGCGGRI